MNTISKKTSEFLKVLVKSKYNILIGGGTSSGKTTFLNAMSEYIDDFERIITIEDSRELNLIGKKNLVSLETRNPNNSNKGEIDIKLLIKNSLRMRPDRIIVGEVRSDETLDMLQAIIHKYLDGNYGSCLIFGYTNIPMKSYRYSSGTWTQTG